MPTERRFNLKIMFRRGYVSRIEHGDFGPADETAEWKPATSAPREDFLATWPVPPEHTGKHGILALMDLPSHDDVEFVPQVV